MADKVDSNVTGLSYAEEQSIGVLPVTPTWIVLEPNSYADFGGEITTVARNPINPSRQRKKGVTTDLDANAGFESDFTQTNLYDLLQGYLFADWREQEDEAVNSVTVQAGDDTYDLTDSTGFQVGSLILATGHNEAANNGLKNVTGVDTVGTDVSVSQTLVDEASPPADAKIQVVGFQGVAGDIDVNVPGGGAKPQYTSTALDFTTLDLVPGCWIFMGGDTAQTQFVDPNNNGFKRVFSISTNVLEVDKGGENMVTEASTTETIQLFTPDVLKNEADPALQVRRTYQLERTLGDDGSGTQSEYIIGAVPSTFDWDFNTADKLLSNLTFVGTDVEQRDGATGVKSGNRPALVETDAFNTSSDIPRIKLSLTDGSELFAQTTEISITVDNNLSPNKAIGTLGAFDVTAGQFVVSGDITAYFSTVAATQAVRNNEDVSLDVALVKANAGWVIDVPLITLGGGSPDVEQDEPITLPLVTEAGADREFNHTLLLSNFDYLPDAAG